MVVFQLFMTRRHLAAQPSVLSLLLRGYSQAQGHQTALTFSRRKPLLRKLVLTMNQVASETGINI